MNQFGPTFVEMLTGYLSQSHPNRFIVLAETRRIPITVQLSKIMWEDVANPTGTFLLGLSSEIPDDSVFFSFGQTTVALNSATSFQPLSTDPLSKTGKWWDGAQSTDRSPRYRPQKTPNAPAIKYLGAVCRESRRQNVPGVTKYVSRK